MKSVASLLTLTLLLLCLPAHASTDFNCRPPVEIKRSELTLFGEIHGTNESPSVVAEHVCTIVSSGQAVVLILELPIAEQTSIDRYLGSPGKRKDRSELLQTKFWQSETQDGRASVAMLDLIDRIRELRSQGATVSVVADDGFESKDRDLAIAERILLIRELSPRASIVGLFGNYHTGKTIGTPSDSEHQRVGYRLRQINPFTVNIDFHGGWAWACTPTCGVSRFGSAGSSPEPAKFETLTDSEEGHDAAVVLPRVTASPPAKAISHDG